MADRALALPLAARSPRELRALLREARDMLTLHGRTFTAADLCVTAARACEGPYRVALAGSSAAELARRAGELLDAGDAGAVAGGARVALAALDQGGDGPPRASALLLEEEAFLARFEACDRIVAAEAGWSPLRALVAAEPEWSPERARVAGAAVQIALAALWESWGVQADVVAGAGAADPVVAAIRGGASLEEALSRVVRGAGGAAPVPALDLASLPADVVLALDPGAAPARGSNVVSSCHSGAGGRASMVAAAARAFALGCDLDWDALLGPAGTDARLPRPAAGVGRRVAGWPGAEVLELRPEGLSDGPPAEAPLIAGFVVPMPAVWRAAGRAAGSVLGGGAHELRAPDPPGDLVVPLDEPDPLRLTVTRTPDDLHRDAPREVRVELLVREAGGWAPRWTATVARDPRGGPGRPQAPAEDLLARCGGELAAGEVLDALRTHGLSVPGGEHVERLRAGANEAVCGVHADGDAARAVDAALHAAVAAAVRNGDAGQAPPAPVSVRRLRAAAGDDGGGGSPAWVHARRAPDGRGIDLQVLDDRGDVLMSADGVEVASVRGAPDSDARRRALAARIVREARALGASGGDDAIPLARRGLDVPQIAALGARLRAAGLAVPLSRLADEPSAAVAGALEADLAGDPRRLAAALEGGGGNGGSGAPAATPRDDGAPRSAAVDAPPPPQLPRAREPAAGDARTAVEPRVELAPEAWGRLRERAREAGLTPSAVLCGAFAEVLGRWSETASFSIVVRGAGGADVGSAAVAAGPSDGASLVQRSRALQRRLWEAIDAPAAAHDGPAIAFALLAPDAPDPPAGTTLDCRPVERDGALTFALEAVDGLFPEGVVGALASALGDLLRGLATDGAAWTDPFPVRLPADQRERRAAANATVGPVAERLLHAPFLDRVREDPDRTAVVSAGARLSYGELEARSRALAARLAAAGARADRPIGVAMEKGWEQVVAVLGVLRAGAPYLPIDPALPEPRVRYLVEHGQVGTVLAQPHLMGRLPLPEGIATIALGGEDDDDGDTEAPEPASAPSDVAYVIFTSGSTGVPKGVTIEHRSALNTVLDVNRRFGVGADDRAIAISSLSFDLSVYDVFGVLAAGGAVVVPDPGSARDPGAWADLCAAEGVTLWSSVPALVKLLVDHLESHDRPLPDALRVVMMSGDWIPVTLPARLCAMGDGVRVYGLGGATEASIWSNFHPTTGPEPGWDSIPYGRPLTNQRFHVLDERLEPRPDWVPGELFIAGDGLARGYWRDPAKTHAAFLFHPRTGERLYRTGDFARYRPSGDVEFLGRRDAQVKVHGHRIELGEVETALERHPGVRSAVANVAGDPRGDRRLVAYHVPESGQEPSERDLQDHVAALVPEYMVPTAIARVGAIPLTANGKVDRDALPDVATLAGEAPQAADGRPADALADLVRDGRLGLGPGGVPLRREAVEALARRAAGHVDERPATGAALEIAVSMRVARLLDLDEPLVALRVPLNRLGLDSLAAMTLHDELHAGFGVDVPLRSLMRGMTVAGLAASVAGGDDAEPADEDGDAARRPAAAAAARAAGRQVSDAGATASGGLRVDPDPAGRHEPFGLNDIQQAYLVGRSGLFQLSEVSTHYYVEIDTEDLDVARFERALNRVVARHDMLRAIVLPEGRQRILPDVPPIEIPVEDLSGQDGAERLARRREEMSHQVVATDVWPLLDVRISLTGERTARLHFGIDLLVADAASWALFGRDLVRFYDDPELEPAPLELSFRDYIHALERLEDSDEFRRARDYWLGRDLPGPPELPLARDPQTLETVRFVRHHDELTAEAWQRIKRRAGEEELTPSGLLCAAFSEVLAAWADSPRFTVNVTTYHRPPVHPQMPELVGDFTSLTMLEVDAAGAGSFRERARAAQRRLWEDLDHRQINGVRVLRERARAGRSHGLMPIVFTSVLGIDPEEGLDRLGRQVYGISQTPQVWLDHQVLERGGRLVLSFDWVEGLFPDGMVEAMFVAYAALLRRLAAEPAAWDDPFPVALPPDARERRAAFNATAVDLPEVHLHDGFLERAAAAPERVAVVAGGRRLTYGELEARSRALAAALVAGGAERERPIAIAMEKGWEQAVAALAVVRAGAPYLPLDPALPEERRRYMAERGQVATVLTQEHLRDRPPVIDGVETIAVDDRPPEDVAAPDVVTTPGDVAYVLFTSGSTGLPKGVTIEHRAALNTVLDVNRRFGVGPDDRAIGVSSLSFDLSVYDLFGTLAAGAALVLPDAGRARDPAHWAELCDAERVTVWSSVPALVKLLAEHLVGEGRGLPEALRLVMMSGDWIPVTLPERLAQLGGEQVVSLGGPTEASIWQAVHVVDGPRSGWDSVPYGRPLANHRLHVLDERLEPRPEWAAGEIYVGGRGLARGYWRDPGRTHAAFLFHPRTGERLYRSGDYGRFRPTGEIEFLGRRDAQVKVHGHRIELGEIEAALERLAAVAAAAAAARGTSRDDRRLAAWIVPRDEVSDEALREHLGRLLPASMVPAQIVRVRSIPLNANGKVDRAALPDRRRAAAAAGGDADGGGIAGRVRALVGDTLRIDAVDADVPLMNLGADSMDVVRLALRLEGELGARPEVESLLGDMTVAGLCDFYAGAAA